MKTPLHITILIALLLIGCTGSKKMAKKGTKLDEAGMYAEAASMYYEALRRNRTNIDAKIGLKTAGQKLLNDKLSDFFKANTTGQKEKAVSAYLESLDYAERVKFLGVVLDIPDHYERDFEAVKGNYLMELYSQGQDLMAEERYAEAEVVFAKIGKLDPNFKDAGSLQQVAYLEPLYAQATDAFDLGHYRAAYDAFDKIISEDAGYKDAFTRRAECIERGRYTIAVPAFKNGANNKDVTNQVSLYALNELANMNDPFIKVVDRDNMDRILKEQELALSGVLDDASVVEVGNLLGAQAVLIGEVVNFQEFRSNLKMQRQIGYTSYKAKITDKETNEVSTVTRYRKTSYNEYSQSAYAVVTVNYKLISMETGEILLSKVVDERVDQDIRYAKFEGDRNNLFPADTNGKVITSNRAIKSLRNLMSASQQLPPLQDMRNQVLREVCGGLAYKVSSQIAQHMQ